MKKPILLYVDDEPDALETMKIGLEGRGYIVLTATGGKEALEILRVTIPDLIITDLRMSPMNGFDFFREAKKLPNLADIPVVVLTAVDDGFAQKYGKTLGAVGYLPKPADLDGVEAAITRLIPR